ncbi:RNA-directed DNA polymerase from mobile element jockey [Caerostris extrusa]|uniref:RNA-directed DNA polymerase from mobile element jockey n=1 Tax=Caerostris extrusa TaxID=172846 RepID=A0AAV4VUI0_CAEEX|nr:RNA-directed DNA polymerase from mobile element jockey [Caerostris extrusa]
MLKWSSTSPSDNQDHSTNQQTLEISTNSSDLLAPLALLKRTRRYYEGLLFPHHHLPKIKSYSKAKTATILPIPKPGKVPTNPESYRPISLLSTLSKITESIILNRFNQFVEPNNIICKERFGFRRNFSTTHIS